MSSLPPNLVKATTGQYSIPIRAIFSKAWQCVKGIKKAFWGGVTLLFLTLLGLYVIFTLVAIVFHIFHVHDLVILQFFAEIFFDVLRLLLGVSLMFLALQHLRSQPINSTMVFEFRKNWQPLATIGALFCLLSFLLINGTNSLLNHFHGQGWDKTYVIGSLLEFIVFFILFSYLTLIVTMTMLLVLDKEKSLKESFYLTVKSINRHWFKNIALLFVTLLVFLVFGVITLGIGLIWLLPLISLISAIQYQQIFCESQLEQKNEKKDNLK